MDKGKAPGRLVFSIDVADGRLDAHAVRGVRSVFAKHSLPATWAVADLHAPTTAELLADQVPHEIALAVAQEWSGPQASRRAFYHGLHTRLQQAAAVGASISSITTNHPDPPGHLDLLGKHGILAVRTARSARRRWPWAALSAAKPSALRYGVWKMPVTADLVRDGARAVRAAVNRAARFGETVIICGDAQSIAPSTLERLVMMSAQLAVAGRLQVQTLSGAANAIARRRRMAPAQSVLRAA